jgi:hypothetical protein
MGKGSITHLQIFLWAAAAVSFVSMVRRSRGKDGKGVDHTPPNILVGSGSRFLCLNG